MDSRRSPEPDREGICGEAGIGKTSLARAASETVSRERFRILWGRFHEGQYTPPYGPWKQMTGSSSRTITW